MGKFRLFFSICFLLLLSPFAFAQSGDVAGVIRDARTGEGIPFASVMVKGTLIGVAAGPNGAYKISVPDLSKSVLVFSSVGYKDQKVKINGRTTIDVRLRTNNVLEDVVVVAYGTSRKESVTGSVASVKGKGLAEVPTISIDKALSGKLAGVDISSDNGRPGSFSSIRIRGIGSLNAGSNPLWVIDGIPVDVNDNSLFTTSSSSLSQLNPSDIESITVLKDAAAASAYGSRAANGVILVTTKSGKIGRSSFSARIKYGINYLQSDSGFRMMTGPELVSYFRQAAINAGANPDDPNPKNSLYYPYALLKNGYTNILDQFSRKGKITEYEISGRGGNTKGKYYASLNYSKNEGVFYGIDYTKANSRINASYKLLSNLELATKVNLGYSNSNDVAMSNLYYSNPIWAGLTLFPWTKLKTPSGEWNTDLPLNAYTNPRANAEYDHNKDQSYYLNAIQQFTYKPFSFLTLDSKNSVQASFSRGRRYWSPKAHPNDPPTVQDVYSSTVRITTSNTATMTKYIDGHSFRAVLGQEAFKEDYDQLYIKGVNVNPDIPYLLTGELPKTELDQVKSTETMLSYFLITDYNYDNRYFLQLNFRRDGSSVFGSKRRWGSFWSAATSWNVSREKFWKFHAMNNFKIRLSYGVNGNNSIANYRAFGLYAPYTYNGVAGLRPSQPANPYLSWELNKTGNVGIDYGFFDNRISGSIDVYRRKTEDMLLNKYVPFTSGWGSVFTNIGSLRNTGIEFSLSADLLRAEDFNWNMSFNVSHNQTKILDLAGLPFLGNSVRQVVGKSMYTYYLFDYYGVDPSTGDALWVHEDENTKALSLTRDASKARRYYCGSPEPKLVGGLSTSIDYKGFSLNVEFAFRYGQKVWIPNEFSYLSSDGKQLIMNQMAFENKYWKEPGDVGVNPKPVANNTSNSSRGASDRWLFDGSYTRLRNVTLSYTIPDAISQKLRLRNAKIYLSGQNLYCFNGVNFFDPERGLNGLVTGSYPLTKSIVAGLEISF